MKTLTWLFLSTVIIVSVALGQTTTSPVIGCDFKWDYEAEMVPDFANHDWTQETLMYRGIAYTFYSSILTKKVKVLRIEPQSIIVWKSRNLTITSYADKKDFCINEQTVDNVLDLFKFAIEGLSK